MFLRIEIRLRLATEEYEKKLQEQEADYSAKLRSMSKELNSQLETKEQDFQRQFQELIGKNKAQPLYRLTHVFLADKSYQNENDLQQKLHAAEQRANADDVIQELQEKIEDLEGQIETLNHREIPRVQ